MNDYIVIGMLLIVAVGVLAAIIAKAHASGKKDKQLEISGKIIEDVYLAKAVQNMSKQEKLSAKDKYES